MSWPPLRQTVSCSPEYGQRNRSLQPGASHFAGDRIGHLGKRDIEPGGNCERAVVCGDKANRAVDRRVTYLDAFAATHHAQRAFEAGRVAHSEELLGVRSAALAAHPLRRPELDVQAS